jgi:hypothetical protein
MEIRGLCLDGGRELVLNGLDLPDDVLKLLDG